MEELFNKYIAKKFRKRGDEYHLSEDSKRSSGTFGHSNKLASKIYQQFKIIADKLMKREIYQKLLNQLTEIKTQSTDETENKEQYATYTKLRGFRLNTSRSWNSLLPWIPQIELKLHVGHICIALPDDKNWKLKSFPERLSRIAIKFHVIVVSLTDGLHTECFPTDTAFMVPHKPTKFHTVDIAVELPDECVLLVIGCTQYYLWETDENTDFASGNKTHIAADVLQVFQIRDGLLLPEKAIEQSMPKSSVVPEGGAKWK